MKNQVKSTFLGKVLFVALLVSTVVVRYSHAEAGVNQMKRLPGSALSLEQAVLSPFVFIGRITDVAAPVPDAPGQATYRVKVRIVEMLKGTLEGDVDFSITVRTLPEETAESVPQQGQKYVLFVQGKVDKSLFVERMLSDSTEVVECVKALIKMHALAQTKRGT